MSSPKEIWIEEFHRREGEYIDQGLDPDQAAEATCNDGDLITDRAADRIAGMIDDARERAKYLCQECRRRQSLFIVGGRMYCFECKPKEPERDPMQQMPTDVS